jgi:hypothetical protein
MMTILKPKSKKEALKFTGVYTPQWIHAFLSTYGIAKSTTKSDLLRKIIEDWIRLKKTEISETELLQEIILNAKLQWKLEKSLSPNSNPFVYKKKIERELRIKGVEEQHINYIIRELE